jgi:DNA-binding LacI/PurR family transcriptional regulator
MDGLGQNAAKLIANALNGDRSCTRMCLHSDLIVRKSTMRFKQDP